MIHISDEDKHIARCLAGAFVALIILCVGIWIGSTVSSRHAEAYRLESVENAISKALDADTMLTCKENHIIQAIKASALNGAHVRHYDIFIEIDNKREVR